MFNILQEKKPYTMNPNADPFQSAAMFSQSDIGSMSGQTSSNIQQTASLMSQDEQRKPAWQTPVTQSQQTSQPDSNDYNSTCLNKLFLFLLFSGSDTLIEKTGEIPWF